MAFDMYNVKDMIIFEFVLLSPTNCEAKIENIP